MEAALALGMSPALALRRIVIPQAVRIVIPPVTNDFIAHVQGHLGLLGDHRDGADQAIQRAAQRHRRDAWNWRR